MLFSKKRNASLVLKNERRHRLSKHYKSLCLSYTLTLYYLMQILCCDGVSIMFIVFISRQYL